MAPPQPPRTSPRKRRTIQANLVISAVLHAAIIATLTYFAAREGLLGKELRRIAIEMVREQPPEPETPPEPEPEPEPEPAPENPTPDDPENPSLTPPQPETPPPAAVPPAETPTPSSTTANLAPPPAAPPPVDLPSFGFDGGRSVRTASDPVELYRGLVEHSLRSRWDRPADVADRYFVAEIEVGVDRKGGITASEWKRRSGHPRWDASVQAALAATRSIPRPPPTNFPPRVTIRFDVQEVAE